MKLIKDIGIRISSSKSKYSTRFGLYECPICKKHFETQTKSVKSGKSTKCKSCSISSIRKTHGKSNTRLYKIWSGIKTRCLNANSSSYKQYGAKGISICDEWKNEYISFSLWALSNGYKDDLQIDRENGLGNYEPSNCRWVDGYVQAQNKINKNTRGVSLNVSKNRWESYITYNGNYKFLGTYDNKIDALISYDLFVLDNNLKHTLNNVIDADFNREEWTKKVKKEIKKRLISKKRKVTDEHFDLIMSSNKSSYRLALELPYSKATILKIRNKKSYKEKHAD